MIRFLRLAPAFVVVLVFSSFLIFLLGPISDHRKFSFQGIASLFLVGNVGAFKSQEDYFSPRINPLVHTWSLAIEVQLYILIPILLIFFVRKRMNLNLIVKLVFSLLTIISFLLFIQDSNPEFQFYSLLDRIWQFGLGSLLFLINKQGKLKP